MRLVRCVIYFTFTGAAFFVIGRFMAKMNFNYDRFPFLSYKFEKNGRIYEKIWIKNWQRRVPDMSKVFKRIMPTKKLEGDILNKLPVMINETCIAESVHTILCITGLHCIKIIPGIKGVAVWLCYVLIFNLPYILIQRYNRPRFLRLYENISCKAAIMGESVCVC